MGIVSGFFKRFGYVKADTPKLPVNNMRGFDAAKINRLTSDWLIKILSPDAELSRDLVALRSRSRDLAINNDYFVKFLRSLKINVIGHQGIRLKMDVRDDNGKPDKKANEIIERKWKEWSKKKLCSVNEKLSFRQLLNLNVISTARDGEIFTRIIRGFDNDFGFALQSIEADHCDVQLNKRLQNGNVCRLGIELNEWGKPISYPLLRNHPGDIHEVPKTDREKYVNIPASEIIHNYLIERPKQTRGYPWGVSAMSRLNMLGGYEEAELTAARIAACKMIFFETENGAEYTGNGKNENGEIIMNVEPGSYEKLPKGVKLNQFDPKHPTGQIPEFMKIMLKGAASGLGQSYNSLASDLVDVNFSSLRSGTLEERDLYKFLQMWIVEDFCDTVFEEWLKMQLLLNNLEGLPIEKIKKFNNPKWKVRGWPWVDPLKESKANETSVNLGVKSRRQIAAENGQDIEDVYDELAQEKELAEEKGLILDFSEPEAIGTEENEN